MTKTKKNYTHEEINNMTFAERFETHKWIANNTANKSFAHNKSYLEAHVLSREEVLQFALIGLWGACVSFDNTKTESSFRNYCISMVLNKIRDDIRNNSLRVVNKRERLQENFQSFDAPLSGEGDEDLSPYEVLEDENPTLPLTCYKGVFYNNIEDKKNRDIIDMYVGGMEMSSIATVLNTTRQAVYQRLDRQRIALMNSLFANVDKDIRELVILKLMRKDDEEIAKMLQLEERKVKQLLRKHNRDIKKAFFIGGSQEDFNLLDELTKFLNVRTAPNDEEVDNKVANV